jgi:shikimate kinase
MLDSNIILIGMPGSGKSTVGVVLAKRMGRAFVDTDVLIQTKFGRKLQDIVDRDGYLALRAMEERVLLDLDVRSHVIATGGSAIYSGSAMDHLHAAGIVVYLQVDLGTLKERVDDYETRGLAKRPDQTLDDLFAERSILYELHADITVRCERMDHEAVCTRITEALRDRRMGASLGT